jgi:hypothetical protein
MALLLLKSHPAPSFYVPGTTVPPIPSLLSTHTDLSCHIYVPNTLTVHEELPHYLGPIRNSISTSRKGIFHPYPQKRPNVRFTPEVELSHPHKTPVQSPLEVDDISIDNPSRNALTKIPKPEGEAGRPGRGGYNLVKELGWTTKQYEDVRVSYRIYQHVATMSN